MSLETIKAQVTELKQFIITNNGNLRGIDYKLNGQDLKKDGKGETETQDKPWNPGLIKEIESELSYLYDLLVVQKETIRNISSAVNGDNSDGCEGAVLVGRYETAKSVMNGSGSFEG